MSKWIQDVVEKYFFPRTIQNQCSMIAQNLEVTTVSRYFYNFRRVYQSIARHRYSVYNGVRGELWRYI